MSELDSALADSSNTSASAESAPQTLDGIFDAAMTDSAPGETAAPPESEQPPTPAVEATAPAKEAPAAPVEDDRPLEDSELAQLKGMIPAPRVAKSIDNARAKERETVLREVQQELAPVLPLVQAITSDVQTGSLNGWRTLMKEYLSHPVLGQQVRSELGRALAQMRGQRPDAEDVEPEADLQTADGQLVYSAQQLAKREAWRERQWQKQMEQQIAPLKQMHQQVEQARTAQQMQQRAVSEAQRLVDHWSKQPHFAEHKADIAKAQAEFVKQGTDSGTALGLAYAKVMQDIVLPKLHQQTNQSLVAQAGQKLAASAHNPAAGVPTQPRRIEVAGRSQSAVMDDIFNAAIAEAGGAR